jgi:hypothetical protein
MTDDVAGDLLIWAVFGHAGDGNSDRRGVPAISPASPQNAHEHPTARFGSRLTTTSLINPMCPTWGIV